MSEMSIDCSVPQDTLHIYVDEVGDRDCSPSGHDIADYRRAGAGFNDTHGGWRGPFASNTEAGAADMTTRPAGQDRWLQIHRQADLGIVRSQCGERSQWLGQVQPDRRVPTAKLCALQKAECAIRPTEKEKAMSIGTPKVHTARGRVSLTALKRIIHQQSLTDNAF
jgi:hypothetical protein